MSREEWIVLVEPMESASIGAAARAMRNFGFRSLALVGVPLPAPEDEAFRWASGADSILREARSLDSVESIGDLAGRAAAILSEPRFRDTSRDMMAEIASQDRGNLAFVFEPDHRRLTDEELDSCVVRFALPGVGMSLPQRVALACWERSRIEPSGDIPDVADEEAIARIEQGIDAIIDRVTDDRARPGAIAGIDRQDETSRLLRELLGRAAPTAREATMILGVLRQMSWALDHGSRESES